MRETKFIEQNKEKWTEYEQVLKQQTDSPEKLNELFIHVTDDLSYARTFYLNRSVRVYLNGLAQKIYYNLYKKRKRKGGRIRHFIVEELPQLIYESRKEFRISLIVFLVSMAIGVLSCYMDEGFVQIVLGESYVDMTLENIENGDPMAVYKEKGESGMFLRIAANNLRVALMTFALGAFYAVGTVLIMVKNGVMVGAFQYFFIEQGLFWESFLTIWTHGTLEISAIVIAGAAGLTMGRGLILPGTLSRLKAFQLSARRGLKIMIGITPIIILAGFIEGFFTRYTETPDAIRLFFILACLAFILFYFVFFPWIKAKRGWQSNLHHSYLVPEKNLSLDFDKIKSNGSIISDTFAYTAKNFGKVALYAIGTVLFYLVAVFFLAQNPISENYVFNNTVNSAEPGALSMIVFIIQFFFGSVSTAEQFFVNNSIPFLITVNTLAFAVLSTLVYKLLIKLTQSARSVKNNIGSNILLFSKMLLPALVLAFVFSSGIRLFYLFTPFLLPMIMLWMYVMVVEGKHVLSGITRAFALIGVSFGKILNLGFILILFGILIFMFSDSLLFYFIFEFIGMNLQFEEETMRNIAALFQTGISMFFIYIILAVFMFAVGMLYHSLLEIKEAPAMKKRVEEVGAERRLQGMYREL